MRYLLAFALLAGCAGCSCPPCPRCPEPERPTIARESVEVSSAPLTGEAEIRRLQAISADPETSDDVRDRAYRAIARERTRIQERALDGCRCPIREPSRGACVCP